MAVTSGFYNGLNNDRKYSATQLSDLFEGIITDGVFMSIGSKLMVVANTGMIVNVGTGRAWFRNTWTNNDAILPLEVPTSNIVLNRIDTVVLEVNKTQETRANTIKIVSGVAATSPVKAGLTNNAEVTQYPLAYIYVGAGVTVINQANITNTVGTSECPFITGLMEGMDIDALIVQWQSEWDVWSADQQADVIAWFDTIKDLLGTDPATNLQLQVTAVVNPPLSKTTPVDADYIVAADSAAGNVFKKLTWSNIKASLKTYFDTMYNYYSHPTTHPASILSDAVPVTKGGTGATTAAAGATALGVGTGNNVQHASLGIGTAASGTAGEIRATNNVTAYYSDARLKDFLGKIPNALEKVMALNGYLFVENQLAKDLGYNNDRRQVGVSAQEVQAVLPEAVTSAPISDEYLTVWYEKLVPLLIEAIKEQQVQIDALKAKVH